MEEITFFKFIIFLLLKILFYYGKLLQPTMAVNCFIKFIKMNFRLIKPKKKII